MRKVLPSPKSLVKAPPRLSPIDLKKRKERCVAIRKIREKIGPVDIDIAGEIRAMREGLMNKGE